MTEIQHLILYQPGLGRVPASVFFVDDRAGTVRGLYFGYAGSGTWDEAYFRMEAAAAGVERFLECDSTEDTAFRVDRVRDDRRRRLPRLSATDAAVFAGLCSHRRSWWTFGESDEVSMDAARAASMQPLEGMLVARSPGFDGDTLERIRRHWPLRGF